MIKLFTTGIFWTGILCLNFCYGQSEDVPLRALPMQYNSSFAGESDHLRWSTNLSHLNIREGLQGTQRHVGLFSSLDAFIPAIRSGVGVTAGYTYSSGLYNPFVNNFGIAMAPKFSRKGKYTISPSLDFHYTYHKIGEKEIANYRSRAGLLVNSSKFYAGISVNLYNESKTVQDGPEIPKSMFYKWHYRGQPDATIQLGYTFQRSTESKFSITPQIVVPLDKTLFTSDFRFVRYMLNLRYSKFVFGMSDVGAHVGLQTDKLRITLHHDLSLFYDKPNEISNLSFRYIFKSK